jgi:hypothetical protein
MAIISILAVAGFWQLDTSPMELAAARQEISGSLEQAFVLARARGTDVKVAVGKASGLGEHLPVRLSPGVKWGKPAEIPLPKGMAEPVVSTTTGEAHTILTVTPRHTTLACAWFLHAGKNALCMRLSGQGRLKVLRWHPDLKQWTKA